MNTVIASPYPYQLPPRESSARVGLVIIDMQRDFIEPGGFGAALGNQVEHLQKIVPTVAGCSAHFENYGCRLFTPEKAIGPICQIALRPKEAVGTPRFASEIRGRWDGSWCWENQGTTL